MEWKIFLTVFGTVFVAELGDKTQLATMLFSANATTSRWLVFAAAALGLTMASGIGVMLGAALGKFVTERQMHLVAGAGFLVLGGWSLFRGIAGK
jgi:putative Ca2+/H+ antiporter (TMEM165/GDT1 family)